MSPTGCCSPVGYRAVEDRLAGRVRDQAEEPAGREQRWPEGPPSEVLPVEQLWEEARTQALPRVGARRRAEPQEEARILAAGQGQPRGSLREQPAERPEGPPQEPEQRVREEHRG